jgi:hypothetical protein
MSSTIINLIIQIIAGAIGGNAAAASMDNVDFRYKLTQGGHLPVSEDH